MATKSSTVLHTVDVCLRDFKKKKMNARKQALNTKLVCRDLCIIKENFENQILNVTSKQSTLPPKKVETPSNSSSTTSYPLNITSCYTGLG